MSRAATRASARRARACWRCRVRRARRGQMRGGRCTGQRPSRALTAPARLHQRRPTPCFAPSPTHSPPPPPLSPSACLEAGYADFNQIQIDPDLELLRQDPRFTVRQGGEAEGGAVAAGLEEGSGAGGGSSCAARLVSAPASGRRALMRPPRPPLAPPPSPARPPAAAGALQAAQRRLPGLQAAVVRVASRRLPGAPPGGPPRRPRAALPGAPGRAGRGRRRQLWAAAAPLGAGHARNATHAPQQAPDAERARAMRAAGSFGRRRALQRGPLPPTIRADCAL
jgi:hypothetical protein